MSNSAATNTVPRVMAPPNSGWMTQRCHPIRPIPAASAMGFSAMGHILPGQREVSKGNPTGRCTARTPSVPSRCAMVRTAPLACFEVCWNSASTTECSDERRPKRFRRKTRLTTIAASGRIESTSSR